MLATQWFKQPDTPWTFDQDRFDNLLADIEARRDEFHAQRHTSHDVIEELKAVGMYRAFVPEALGGCSMAPRDFLERLEAISKADGSTGWVASFGFATKYLSSLPAATLEKIYADTPDVVFAGTVFPQQQATKVDGGVRITGRWPFGSGCMGASLIGVGVSVGEGDKSGLPLMAVIPADKVTIDPTWRTIGMASSGSHDLVVEDVFVPDDHILVRGAPPSIDSPGYRYPTLAMAAQVLAVVGLGVAQAALDHVVKVADTSKSITGAPTLGNRTNVQIHLAECEGKLQSARAWFYQVTDQVWEQVLAGDPISRDTNMHLRLASSHLARTGAEVARACFEMSGTAGIFQANPLSRYLTDAMVVAQHAFLTEGSFMNAGKVMVGHDRIPGFD